METWALQPDAARLSWPAEWSATEENIVRENAAVGLKFWVMAIASVELAPLSIAQLRELG